MAKVSAFEGVPEMLAVLKELPEALQKNALSTIARAGAVALQKEAKTQLGMSMSRSVSPDDVIIKKRRSPKGEVRAEWVVGPPTRKPQLRWLHDGTKPHAIEVRNAEALASGDQLFGEIVQHPGQPPRPWLQRAYFVSTDACIKAMAQACAKALVKQARNLVSKKYRGRVTRNLRGLIGL